MRIWLDTDLGTDVDDALALAYAIRHPDIELVGISTVFGDVELRTEMVQVLLDKAGIKGLPVCTGLGKPLSPARKGVMFGHEGDGLLPDAAPTLRVTEDPEGSSRIERMAEAIRLTRPDVVVAIGPMTNLGALTELGVSWPRLAIMGGKVADATLPGMSPAIEEWNWWCDPRAVQLVLEASHPVPPRIVPAEVTFRTALADGDVERLATGDPFDDALSKLSERWLDAQREFFKTNQPRVALHDPLTLATLVQEDLCEFAPRDIAMDDEGRTTEGAGTAVEVAVDVDVEATRVHLMETWLSSSPPR